MQIGTHYDAVVVGGGHNGLVAACYLAQAGQSVLVLERNSELGGATSSQRIFPGMDAYLSRYSYLVSLFPRRIVADLGLDFTSRRRSIASCTPYERGNRAAALLLSNDDENLSRDSLQALAGEGELHGYEALMEMRHAFAQRVWPGLLAPLQTRQHWKDSLATPTERAAWDAFVERPLGESLERYLTNDVIRGVVFTDAKVGVLTHPHDETLLQNRCFVMHIVGNGTGEWQVPVGGMGALVRSLSTTARHSGAELMVNAPVDAIHTGSRYHTVTFQHDGHDRTVDATRVLVNAGPQVFDRLLGRTHVTAPGDEGSVCKVNMLLRRLPRLKANEIASRDAFGGTFHFNQSYRDMQVSYQQAVAGQIPDRPPAEIYCHTITDNSILGEDLRDAGYHTLTLFGLDAPYRLFETDHEIRKIEFQRRYIRDLDKVLLDSIEDCLAVDENGNPCIEIKSPQDLENEISLYHGNIFHGELSWFFADQCDDVNTWGVETPFERIYRCGSSALRGGAVSGIPGHNAAQCIFDELGINR